MSFDMMHMPGPCVVCGDTGYTLSCGGPSICPKCDCGNFDAATVMKQAKVIAELREQLAAALAWHCCDERYPWIKGIVTTSPITLDAWRDSGIKHQPLYPRTPDVAQAGLDPDTVQACYAAVLEERCQRGTPWDLACTTIARKLLGLIGEADRAPVDVPIGPSPSLRCLRCGTVDALGPVVPSADRPCTCHPDDNPPSPCARKYALSACRAWAEANPSPREFHSTHPSAHREGSK